MRMNQTAGIGLTVLSGFLCLLAGGCPALLPSDGDNAGVDLLSDGPSEEEIRESLTSQAPTARAGDDQTVTSGQVVALSALSSTDPQGERLFFVWQQVDGDSVTFDSSGYQSIVRFTAPQVTIPTTLEFSLTVGNGYRAAVDNVTITVNPSE